MNGSCTDCVYWKELENNDGWCRRYPKSQVVSSENLESYFPIVNSTDWCGEYHPNS